MVKRNKFGAREAMAMVMDRRTVRFDQIGKVESGALASVQPSFPSILSTTGFDNAPAFISRHGQHLHFSTNPSHSP